MKLKNKVAIITGAASGLGKEIAKKFANEGATVIVTDLNEQNIHDTVNEIKQNGGDAFGLMMNVTDEEQVVNVFEKVKHRYSKIDILVSNAGYQHIEALDTLSFSNWKKMLAVHLDGAFLTTRSALQVMYQQNSGSIIYIGSVHSKEASLLKAPYVTAKHGLVGLCKTVAKEGAKHNVRANLICPGFVLTPLVEKQIPEQAQQLNISEQEVIKNIMLKDTVDGEFTTTEDIAETAVFAAAFPSNALTGQSIIVSHGWGMR